MVSRPAREPAQGWAITDHACRCCFGRVLMRETFERKRVYRCACCGVEAQGRTEASICACGIKLKTGVDAGIRCGVNHDKSPEWPAEITAMQIQPPTVK